MIIIPVPKSTTNIQIHHFKTTFVCPRSIAGVLSDSVRCFRASLSLHTTSISVCDPDVIGVSTAWRHNNNNKKMFMDLCFVLFLFCLSTCVSVCLQVQGHVSRKIEAPTDDLRCVPLCTCHHVRFAFQRRHLRS